MRIAVDGYELNAGFTGVGRFLFNLLKSLSNIDRENTYTVFLSEDYELPWNPRNIDTVVLRSDRTHTRWQNFKLRKALNRENFDLFFSPNHSIPLFYNGFSMMTIPDVSWKGVPEDFSVKERRTRDLRTRLSIRKCQLIFTISQFSKNEILKYYKADPEKIVPIHLGIEKKFAPAGKEEIREFRIRYGLGESRVLGFLGSMFRRRHIQDIIDAFNIIRKDMDVRLFLAGADHYRGGLRGLHGDGIIYIDRLPEEEINAFYSSLDLFLYLSDYEGFGFPPLEALSCGTVPLLLNSSSLREVYGDLAFFTETAGPEALSARIRGILGKGKKETGEYLERFGKKKDYFNWERTAGEFLEHFRKMKTL